MSKHPNSATALGSASVVAVVLYVLSLFGVEVPEPPMEVTLALGGLASSLALLIGRSGVRGLLSMVWRGRG